jgi:hypothetical protein
MAKEEELKKEKRSKRKRKGKKRAQAGRPPKRPFPSLTFEDVLPYATIIQELGAGYKVKREDVFARLGKSPKSGSSKNITTQSNFYGLTTGSWVAEYVELTEKGKAATSPDVPDHVKKKAHFELAINNIKVFHDLYEQFKDNRLPDRSVLRNILKEKRIAEKYVNEGVDMFMLNAKFLRIIENKAGVERLLSFEEAYREITGTLTSETRKQETVGGQFEEKDIEKATKVSWSNICFYISPIGEEGTEQRKHSDFFLHQIVEPALDDFGLRIVRADDIGKPGMITAQIIEHLVKAKLAIADLSFHNPNVFYELSLRHVCRLPTVQIIRQKDRIPFDLDQFRTIKVDTDDVYGLYPKLEEYKSEVANQVRKVLDNPEEVDNPITTFCPNLEVKLPPGIRRRGGTEDSK